MKKRTILALLLIINLLYILTACSSSSSLSGRYVIADVIDDPEGVTFAALEKNYSDTGINVTDYLYMEFFSGSRFKLIMFGEEEAAGTYTLDGNTLTLTAEGGTTTADVSGKKITWIYSSGGKLVFEKN